MTDQKWNRWFGQLLAAAEAAVDRLVHAPRGGDEERRAHEAVRAAQADIRKALDTPTDEELAATRSPGAG